MKTYFNPGCALSLYKPEMEQKILAFLNENYGDVELHKICCRHEPKLDRGSVIINVCAGCDRRFGSLYDGISTISLWEILDNLDCFEFPDYRQAVMTVHDPCPVRHNEKVHESVRNLLNKMNIKVVENRLSRTKSVCCGDNFYPTLSVDKVHTMMAKRAESMPCEDVVVYCVSCIKAMHIGNKTPRYLIDLLMNESTEPQIYDTVKWHDQLQDYIDKH